MSVADQSSMSASGHTEHDVAEVTAASKVPNSPSTAFAALSLSEEASPSSSASASTSNSIFTPAHVLELDSATALVNALDTARKRPKPLIRSTGHLVPRTSPKGKGLDHHHLLSWKVAEFAYRKSSSVGSELPTLARGLFTERIDDPSSSSSGKHRIAVRGYDKFFNLGELPWTKPDTITHYTTSPYVLTFKENGCIIFISALSPTQLVVTSKHSLGSIEGTDTTHAQKGHEWLLKHLSTVSRTESQLAAELWRRNETAAFELCDDSFEEHVLAYTEARSGLHLHGLNANSVEFRTLGMTEVDAFADEWGFIRTRWIEMESLEEVQRVTKEIEQTGAWEGEPIEGFVIRTHMPDEKAMQRLKEEKEEVVSPPYKPGQAWFYKVKFDEPYLMYRDWRELARKMVKEKAEWEAKVASLPAAPSTDTTSTETDVATNDDVDDTVPERAEGEAPSKAALKRHRKRLAKQTAAAAAASRAAAQSAGLLPPSPPQPRSKRPETALFITWCYDRLYGNPLLHIQPQPHLFAGLTQNKGIIAMRNAFLSHLTTAPAQKKEVVEEEDTREFSKTILTPIAVPGCGKTVLALALSHLFSVGHIQSDDYKKKTGFLGALEKDLRSHSSDSSYVVFADKNNHLFQHRDDLISLTTRLSTPSPPPAGKKAKPQPEIGRIRNVALAWDLGMPLNTLHRICAERIEKRGDNHQTLVADPDSGVVSGVKSHEVVLWRFLESLQPFGSAAGGEGGEGWGDGRFDEVVWLKVGASAEENLKTVVRALGWKVPSEDRIAAALERAYGWKVGKQAKVEEREGRREVRYFGLAVELDVRGLLDGLLSSPSSTAPPSDNDDTEGIAAFYRSTLAAHRLNLRPHITLVHHANLPHDSPKWEFYTHLLSTPLSRTPFTVTLSTLLYERGKLLTFPIDTITPPDDIADDFQRLHYPEGEGERWTPHVTLATVPEVRPYESNRVVAMWKEDKLEGVEVVRLEKPVSVPARVFGMS